MNTALWIIPILPFILAMAKTWSLSEAIAETVWFNVAYVSTLAAIYALELAGYGGVSTSPTGPGGAIAIGAGFIAVVIRRRQWRKERARVAAAKAAAAAEERDRRAAAGQPAQSEERSLIVDAFRFAGSLQKARRNAKR